MENRLPLYNTRVKLPLQQAETTYGGRSLGLFFTFSIFKNTLYNCWGVRSTPKMYVLGMVLNCIWWVRLWGVWNHSVMGRIHKINILCEVFCLLDWLLYQDWRVNLPYYLPIDAERKMPLLRTFAQSETQTALSRIWTFVVKSISCNVNSYTMHISITRLFNLIIYLSLKYFNFYNFYTAHTSLSLFLSPPSLRWKIDRHTLFFYISESVIYPRRYNVMILLVELKIMVIKD